MIREAEPYMVACAVAAHPHARRQAVARPKLHRRLQLDVEEQAAPTTEADMQLSEELPPLEAPLGAGGDAAEPLQQEGQGGGLDGAADAKREDAEPMLRDVEEQEGMLQEQKGLRGDEESADGSSVKVRKLIVQAPPAPAMARLIVR